MTELSLWLVLVSALTHAYWNFLLKRTGGGEIVVGLSKIVEALVFGPLFVGLSLPSLPATDRTATLIGVAAGGVLITYVALTLAYRHGDLSLVYPIQRGVTLLVLPFAGWLAIGERVSKLGAAGLTVILVGLAVIQLPTLGWSSVRNLLAHLRGTAALWAVLVGFNNAVFTIWDKYALRTLPPFGYMYSYTTLVALSYFVFLIRKYPVSALGSQWREHRSAIVQVGVLNTGSYLLILVALRTGISSYVIGVRQISIAFGVLMGAYLLGERMTRARWAGAGLIAGGAVLVSLASW